MAAALAGCGGSVREVHVGDDAGSPGDDTDAAPPNPRCPAPAKISDGAACNVSGVSCPESLSFIQCDGSARPLLCFCDGSSWNCEHDISAPCPTSCPAPSAISNGGACAVSGQSCPSTNLPTRNCVGSPSGGTGSGYCSCGAGGWSCPTLEAPCLPPVPVCPDPSKVIPGGSCGVQSGLVCDTTLLPPILLPQCPLTAPNGPPTLPNVGGNGTCSCDSGKWNCEQPFPIPPICPEASCPPPGDVWADGVCSTNPSFTCSGNAQVCGTETYYDAFRCTGGYWQQLTTTVCDLYDTDAEVGMVVYDAGLAGD